ncbi:MAG: YggS family pyridoxal phosphate-dependent enzyme [Lachnospiraceae bacterium]|nr:YggS family pyridoxal phosphate-dependent enzyme [Lachnospiraceae bacterium]
MAENIKKVRERIAGAAGRAGRDASEITLVAVSKTKPVSVIEAAYRAGERVFGENRVQELSEKFPVLPNDIAWHMIGHLQTNKVKHVLGKAVLIHSLDNIRLAQTIQEEAQKRDLLCQVLLEVNVAGEDSKFGLPPQGVEEFVRQIAKFDRIRVKGLMTVAPFTEKPEENRKYFRQMKRLAVDISGKNIDNVSMEVLSMGMTGDFEVAVEEGATMVRVGTGIFGERGYH